MHWADIYAAIYKQGSTPSAIAKEEKVSPAFITYVIKGQRTSHRIAYAVASVTGITTEKMWPGKYMEPSAYKQVRGSNSTGRLPSHKGGSND